MPRPARSTSMWPRSASLAAYLLIVAYFVLARSRHGSEAVETLSDQEREWRKRDLDRLFFFSDGVYAIALTLLSIELVERFVTTSESTLAGNPSRLGEALAPWGTMDGAYVSFLYGFAVVALFWTAHHRLFRHIDAAGRISVDLIVANFLLLFFVVLIPFTTFVWGLYPEYSPAISWYAANLFLCTAAQFLVYTQCKRYYAGRSPTEDYGKKLVRPAIAFLVAFILSFLPYTIFASALLFLTWAFSLAQLLWRTRR